MQDQAAYYYINSLFRSAKRIILLDSFCRAFWPLGSLFLLLFGISASGWLIGAWEGAIFLFWFGAGLGLFLCLCYGYRNISKDDFNPGIGKILNHIERDRGDKPVSGFLDILANPSPSSFTRTIWEMNRIKLRKEIFTLPYIGMISNMAQYDPFAVRLCAMVVCITGLIIGGGVWRENISHSFYMPLFSLSDGVDSGFEIWAKPPAYTKLPDRYFGNLAVLPMQKETSLPIGTRLIFHATDFSKKPILNPSLLWKEQDKNRWQAEQILQKTTKYQLKLPHHDEKDWEFKILPDLPPKITLSKTENYIGKNGLQIPLIIEDDYAIKAFDLIISLDGAAYDSNQLKPDVRMPLTLSLPTPAIMGGQPVSFLFQSDLSSHPYAGLPVTIQFRVTDGLNQMALSSPLSLTLPERGFEHPLAKKMVEVRKSVVWSREQAIKGYFLLQKAIFQQKYKNESADIGTWLTSFVSASRLRSSLEHQQFVENRDSIASLLWWGALLWEEGKIIFYQNHLDDIQKSLLDALSRDASQEEIASILEEIQQTLQDLMREKMNNKPRNSGRAAKNIRKISAEEFSDLLKDLEKAALKGDRQAVDELMSMIAQIMFGLQSQSTDPFQSLIADQKSLIEKTDSGSMPIMSLKQTQKKLRDTAGNLAKAASSNGEKPIKDALEQAQTAMAEAETMMALGKTDKAVEAQFKALSALRDGQTEQQTGKTGQNGQQKGKQSPIGKADDSTDPFGRPGITYGPTNGDSTKTPLQSEAKKIRDVIEQIRHRSSDQTKPEIEKEHLKRLQNRF